MNIAFGCDHRAFPVKDKVLTLLKSLGHTVTDFGTNSAERVDAIDYARPVSHAVLKGEAERGILLCMSGHTMALVANRTKGIRAANCADVSSVQLARAHMDANVLCIGTYLVGEQQIEDIIKAFLSTEAISGDPRYGERIKRLTELE